MSPTNKRYLIALGATVLLHALLLALLFLLSITGDRPSRQHEEVVLVDLGNVPEASGEEEPEGIKQEGSSEVSEPAQEPEVKPTPQTAPALKPTKPAKEVAKPKAQAEKIQTQIHEESLRLKEEQTRQAKAQEEAKRKAEEEQRRKAQEEALRKQQEEQRRQVGNSVAGAFGAGKGKASSHGNGHGQGNQGSTQGVAGGSFSLSGRSIISNGGNLTAPKANKAIEGKLVIAIEVNSAGTVTSATVSPRGSNIADPAIRAEAIRAARATSFNPQEGAATQRGTITYIYVLKH